jgi:hypothetical protein
MISTEKTKLTINGKNVYYLNSHACMYVCTKNVYSQVYRKSSLSSSIRCSIISCLVRGASVISASLFFRSCILSIFSSIECEMMNLIDNTGFV